MLWLTWRQFRSQARIGLGAMLLLALYLAWLDHQVHSGYSDTLGHCSGHNSCVGPLAAFADHYSFPVDLLGYLLLAVPGVIGAFWGAPLISRELEAGTHRLVWNQSVTRRRWLAAKLGLVGLLSTGVTGCFSLLLTWAAGPVNTVLGNRFEPVVFGSRGLVPFAYAAFAFALGATLGLFLRRTVPAMGATLVAFAVLQILVATAVRPHYEAPVRTSVTLTSEMISNLSMIGTYGDIAGLHVPGGPWVVQTSPLLDANGHEVGHGAWYQDCTNNKSLTEMPKCLAAGNIHVVISEQPADRYWTFQWIEAAIYTVLSVLLAALSFWCIRRRLA